MGEDGQVDEDSDNEEIVRVNKRNPSKLRIFDEDSDNSDGQEVQNSSEISPIFQENNLHNDEDKVAPPTKPTLDTNLFDTEEDLENSENDCSSEVNQKKHDSRPALDTNIFDTEEDLDNTANTDSDSQCETPTVTNQKNQKTARLKSADLKRLHSDTQRVCRQARINLPYHVPPQRTLAEFLEHRRKSSLPVPPVLKPTRTDLQKWRDSEAANIPHEEIQKVSETVDEEPNVTAMTGKERIRALKEAARKTGFIPRLGRGSRIVLDGPDNGNGHPGVEDMKERFISQLRKSRDEKSGPRFDKGQEPKLIQLKKVLQEKINRQREERYALKIEEFNREREEDAESECAEDKLSDITESEPESDTDEEENPESDKNDEPRHQNPFIDDEAEEDDCSSEPEASRDSPHVLPEGGICAEKENADNADCSLEIIGSMIAPHQPNGGFRCRSQQSEDLFEESLLAGKDTTRMSDADELLGLCSGRFTGAEVSRELAGNPGSTQEVADELLLLCSGKFESQVEVGLREDEDSASSFVEVKKAKSVAKVIYSDDEEEEDDDEKDQEGNENDEIEDDEDDKEDDEDDNEKLITKKANVEFFEDEAELSGSDASSDEEEDPEDDILEEELGDKDELASDEELHQQVAKIHMKMLMDEDKNNLMVLKEHYLEDGDLDGGRERPRQFRWKTTNEDFEGSFEDRGREPQGPDEEDDGHWRKEMYERERWLEENAKMPEDVDDAVKGSLVLKPEVSNREIVTMDLSPKKANNGLQGAFLHRGKAMLERLARITKSDCPNPNGPRSSRNFVFATVSPKKDAGCKLKRNAETFCGPLAKKPRLEKSLSAPQELVKRKSVFDYF